MIFMQRSETREAKKGEGLVYARCAAHEVEAFDCGPATSIEAMRLWVTGAIRNHRKITGCDATITLIVEEGL
jgi:hypothetical protein